jgi:MoxR-like ATPase
MAFSCAGLAPTRKLGRSRMKWINAATQAAGLGDPGLDALFKRAEEIILGKQEKLRLVLCALLADGHVLIEDLPGVGKTTLVRTLAGLMGLKTTRVQFTNDLLPADILGTSIFDAEKKEFKFHAGPIFGQLLIADELNRATPKTQSALLQAMEEKCVTVDGITHPLPRPFFVVATQNPTEQTGTYPLPESQLDRFLMRVDVGYPERDAEIELLRSGRREGRLHNLEPVITPLILNEWQDRAQRVHVGDTLLGYLQSLLDYTRSRPHEMEGLSPRAGLAWLRSARAWAFLHQRTLVLPEDIQAVGPYVMAHRLPRARGSMRTSGSELARQVLDAVSVE